MKLHKSSLACMMLAFSASAFAQRTTDFRDCPRFFVNETPPSVTNISAWHPRALCFDSFAVMHSGQTRTPLYVAERLNRDRLMDARHERRTDRFYEEARLPRSERSQLSDYAHSGYDRGHLAPAGDQPNTMAMAQSFSLSNMIPQASENNRGPWADIEKATRKYAMRARGDVYVITGPVFTENSQSIGANHVRVPDYIYKLVYDASTNRAWAHWIENTNEAEIRRPISYAELVKRTGIDFLPGVRPE